METVGLIFIPDISGFTRFVRQVEIEHSRLIIQELLEILIDSNRMGLEVSEVEGDAILFYKFGERPTLREVYDQVERMFTEFHRSLMIYESRRYCQCEACLSAVHLTLKVITHYGEFAEYHVKHFNKLIGKDVIVAHQLLKNDIEQHDYWMVTDELHAVGQADIDRPLRWADGYKQTEAGEVHFRYAPLGFLKDQIFIAPAPAPDLSERTKVISLTRDYPTDLITLLHATADFSYRSQWMEGVEKVEVQHHFLPRVGHRAVIFLKGGKTSTAIANHYVFGDETVTFSEIEKRSGDLTYCTLEKIDEGTTRLILHYYIGGTLLSQLMFRLGRKRKLSIRLKKSLENLRGLIGTVEAVVRSKLQPA